MTIINETNFKTNMSAYLDQAVELGDAINITTSKGNAVILGEKEYNSLVETLYLYQHIGTLKDFQICEENRNNPDFWVDEKEVNWNV